MTNLHHPSLFIGLTDLLLNFPDSIKDVFKYALPGHEIVNNSLRPIFQFRDAAIFGEDEDSR